MEKLTNVQVWELLNKDELTEEERQELGKIKWLDLSGMSLSTIPDTIGILTCLQILDLSYNSISEVPSSICKLKRLEVLDLSGNKLYTIPEGIASLACLKALYLSGNNISEVPASISTLTSLKTLDLSFNTLLSIPIELIHLPNLMNLDISGLSLTSIPFLPNIFIQGIWFNESFHLSGLIMRDTSLLLQPLSLFHQPYGFIEEYYNSEKIRISESKIILVGDHRQLPPLFNEHEKTYQEVAEQQEGMEDIVVPLTMEDFNKYKDM